MRTYLIPFAISMAAISVITSVACGDAPGRAPVATSTATTATTTVTATSSPIATPEPNVATVVPVATATSTPPATVTVAPTEPPTATPEAPAELPQVLWVLSDHAGPGVVTVRWATSVPTTGEVRVMSNHQGDAYSFSDVSDVAATEHAVSVPANFGRYVVVVEDAHGQQATATLRYEKDPQGVQWGTGGLAPLVKADGSKHLLVEWGFVNGHQGNGFAASALVFTKDADCTTADACQGELLAALAAQKEHTPNADYYRAYTAIPGAAFDYQVLVVQPLTADETGIAFLQLEIGGHELPKTKLTGPGTITG
ncbi:MAG: hypothetical protein IT303_06480 [Dehalococcoidia bacterium]|nr:hypothetical protein [Dehalococcoidia bacterium]